MKSKLFLAGIPCVMLIFGLLLTGCPTDNSGTRLSVRSVTVESLRDTLEQGEIYTGFSADVDTDDGVNKDVLWDIESSTTPLSPNTNISHTTGVLHIAPDETVGNRITVTATSTVDTTKSGPATVTITASSSANGRITTTTTNFRRGGKITFTATDITPPLIWTVTGNSLSSTGFVTERVEEPPQGRVTTEEHGTSFTTDMTSVILMIDSDEPVGKELLVTVTSKNDPSKTANYLLTVADKPDLTSLEITSVQNSDRVPMNLSSARWVTGVASTLYFTAITDGDDDRDPFINWLMSGNQSNETNIDGRILTIAADETATTLTVTATSSSANLTVKTKTVIVKPMLPVGTLNLSSDFYLSALTMNQFKDLAVGNSRLLPRDLNITATSSNNLTVSILDNNIGNNVNLLASDKVTWSIEDQPGASYAEITNLDDGRQTVKGKETGMVYLTATIENGTAPGMPYTQKFRLDIVPLHPTLTITYDSSSIPIDPTAINILRQSLTIGDTTSHSIAVDNQDDYSHFEWIINGITVQSGDGVTNSSYMLRGSDFQAPGIYYLTIIAYKNGMPYSREVSISVSSPSSN
jgi:hypothetical protein